LTGLQGAAHIYFRGTRP